MSNNSKETLPADPPQTPALQHTFVNQTPQQTSGIAPCHIYLWSTVIGVIVLFLFCPLPYYQSEIPGCINAKGVSCPDVGWHTSPSIFSQLTSHELVSTDQPITFEPVFVSPAPPRDPEQSLLWKTFTTDMYDFTFRHPSTYAVHETEGLFIIDVSNDQTSQTDIIIDARQGPVNQTLAIAQETIRLTYAVSTTEYINQWSFYHATGYRGEIEGKKFLIAIAPYRTGVIRIETSDNQESEAILMGILTSFQFTK